MAFTSLYFLCFLAIVIGLYYAVPIKNRWIVLLLASYAFYLLSSPKTFVFLLFTTAVTFGGGKAIGKKNAAYQDWLNSPGVERTREQKKAKKALNQKQKKKWVAAVLIINFGVLAGVKYFKYYLNIIGLDWSIFDAGVLIPLGISFYTFQSAAYIIDLYRGKIDADRNICKFALYMSFFPQIIQGPIARYDHLAGQLYEGHKFQYENLTLGAQLILWGLVKKLIVADRAAIIVNEIFDNHADYAGFYIFVALFMYCLQIYGDFSGGIDIARGAAQCMGIDMADNFKRPYFADSLGEFWRRWHMSLSFWCRDYIFYPIAMSKTFGKMGKSLRNIFGDRLGKLFPVIVAQMATFIVIGIWHGAEFKYVAYGLYNGFIIVSGLILEPYFRKWEKALHINTETFSWQKFKVLRTFCIVMFGRVFPKAASFTVALEMIRSIFYFNPAILTNGALFELGLCRLDWNVLIVTCAIWFVASMMAERGINVREFVSKQNFVVRWTIWVVAVTVILICGIYGPGYDSSAFIYRNF